MIQETCYQVLIHPMAFVIAFRNAVEAIYISPIQGGNK